MLKKLVVLDPGYAFPTGHHQALNALIKRNSAAWNCEISILTHKALTERGIGRPALSPRIYSHSETAAQLAQRYAQNVDLFEQDLANESEEILSATHILIHTCAPELVPPIARLASALLGQNSSIRIHLNFFFGGFFWLNGTDVDEYAQNIFRQSLQSLRPEHLNVTLSSETKGLADRLSHWTQRSVYVSKYPRGYPAFPEQPTAPSANGDATFLYIGKLRSEKGVSLIFDAIKRIAIDRPNFRVRFVVPDAGSGFLSEAQKYRDFVSVRILPHDDETAYFAEIAQADFVLCTYLPDMYRERGSGIFLDALGMGVPVIATQKLGFIADLSADELAAVELLQVPSGAALLAAMDSAARNIVARKSSARNIASRIRRLVDPDRWFSELTGDGPSGVSEP